MVDAVSFNDNTNRNTAIAAGVGAIGGGTAGYMTKKILKNNEFTDEFVKTTMNNIMDALLENKESREISKDLYNLGEEPNLKQAKKFLQKWEKQIEEYPDEIKELLKRSEQEIIDEVKDFRESMMNEVGEDSKSLKQTINELFEDAKSVYTKNKNSFKGENELFSKEELKALSKAERTIKGKAGLIWGAATAAVLGISTYIISKVFGHKEG